MRLSVIVPVYNEESHLADVIAYLYSVALPLETEYIFVDDKSTDSSLNILKSLQPKYKYRILENKQNGGKGFSIINGIDNATGDLIIIQDADFEYDPNDIPLLLTPLIENKADVVFGSRFKKNSRQVHRTYHYFVNRLLTLLSNLASGIYLTDMETCYKAFRADLLQNMKLTSMRFGIEVELTAYVAKTSARIHEMPINYYPRTTLQGKKINWKDGVAALFHILRFNRMDLKSCFKSLPTKYNPGRSKFEIFKENNVAKKDS
jgi:Glycosyltransferases involved in cell wall biogenesis